VIAERLMVVQKEIQRDLTGLRRQLWGEEDIRVTVRDPAFDVVVKTVFGHNRTMLGRDRLWVLWQAVRNVAGKGTAAAEVGTYRGGSAYFIAASFARLLGEEVPVEVIDTFAGHPKDKLSEYDGAYHHRRNTFTKTSYESVSRYLSTFERVTVHKGEFSRVAPSLPERQYGLVHLDVDLYEATLDCLRYFGPRMAPGGVILLDDYCSPMAGGIQRASEEYLSAESGFQTWHPHTKQLLLVKRG
jgi:O-methyltransferase